MKMSQLIDLALILNPSSPLSEILQLQLHGGGGELFLDIEIVFLLRISSIG
jgi:hypothetical protein